MLVQNLPGSDTCETWQYLYIYIKSVRAGPPIQLHELNLKHMPCLSQPYNDPLVLPTRGGSLHLQPLTALAKQQTHLLWSFPHFRLAKTLVTTVVTRRILQN